MFVLVICLVFASFFGIYYLKKDSADGRLLTWKVSLIVPNRIYPYYLLMKLFIETGDMEKAQENAKIVLTKEPKVQSTAVSEMREEAERIMSYEL